MKELARKRASHPKIRALALNILRQYGTRSHDYLSECQAIGDFVKNHVAYVRDIEGVEQLHDPLYMVEEVERGTAAGDCDDMSLLIATLLLSVGGRPLYRAVRYQGKFGPFNHIYTVCYDRNNQGPRKRFVMDAILKDKPIGYEIQHASGEEFAV